MPSLLELNDPISTTTVNLTYLLDVSGSMSGQRIRQLNSAMRDAVDIAEQVARNMEAELKMRVIKFSNDAEWYIGDVNNGVSHIDWKDLDTQVLTNTAAAIDLAGTIMHQKILGVNSYQPVVILFTDGGSNDPQATIEAAERLKKSLHDSKGNPRVLCISVGVCEADMSELEAFASIGTIKHIDGTIEENVPLVFKTDNIDELTSILKSITLGSLLSSIKNGSNPVGGQSSPSVVIDQNLGNSSWDANDLVGTIAASQLES